MSVALRALRFNWEAEYEFFSKLLQDWAPGANLEPEAKKPNGFPKAGPSLSEGAASGCHCKKRTKQHCVIPQGGE